MCIFILLKNTAQFIVAFAIIGQTIYKYRNIRQIYRESIEKERNLITKQGNVEYRVLFLI